jgi:hypothetical protein
VYAAQDALSAFGMMLGMWISARWDFLPLFVIVSGFVVIFTNLSDEADSNGERLSAYSVFNRGFQELAGTLSAEQLDRMLRRQGEPPVDDQEEDVLHESNADGFTMPLRKVKPNEACPCNSGKKYKKCHMGKASIAKGGDMEVVEQGQMADR